MDDTKDISNRFFCCSSFLVLLDFVLLNINYQKPYGSGKNLEPV